MSAYDPLDHLDASLRDFEPMTPPPSQPLQQQQQPKQTFGYPSHHSGFRSDDTESDLADPVDSPGGYSPPAWRRLGNGNRDNGFWPRSEDQHHRHHHQFAAFRASRESSPDLDGIDEDDVLREAMRTRLPTGSMSPDKRRSPSPEPKPASAASVKLEEVPWGGKGHDDKEEADNCKSVHNGC